VVVAKKGCIVGQHVVRVYLGFFQVGYDIIVGLARIGFKDEKPKPV
jgi:hypothetical protein